MKLGTHHPGVIAQLGDFHEAAIGRESAEIHPCTNQQITVLVVEFEAVAVPFGDQRSRVRSFCSGSGHNLAGIHSKTHGPPHI